MQPSLDVRRHNDGSIDFDFYRRCAARRRLHGRQCVPWWSLTTPKSALSTCLRRLPAKWIR